MTTKIHEEGEGGGAGAAGATTTGSVGNTPGTDTGWGVNPPKKKMVRRKTSLKEFLEGEGVSEAIKGWKHAHSDIMKARADASAASNSVVLHQLRADGKESGMHDARKSFRTDDEARAHVENIKKLNPTRKYRYNKYVNGQHVGIVESEETEMSAVQEFFGIKSFDDVLCEAWNPNKKDARGGSVAVMVNTQHPEGHSERYQVSFKPNKSSPRGRTSWQTVSSHASAEEASKAKKAYADKMGYKALEEDVDYSDSLVESDDPAVKAEYARLGAHASKLSNHAHAVSKVARENRTKKNLQAAADAHHAAMQAHDAAHSYGADHGIHTQNRQGWEHSVSHDSYRSAALRANEGEELEASDVLSEQYDHIYLGAKVQPKHAVDKSKPMTVHRIVSDDTAEVSDEFGNKHKMHFGDLLPHHESEQVEGEMVAESKTTSDDAFDKLKAAGAKNIKTTSVAIHYNHPKTGESMKLRHRDEEDGARRVKTGELNDHLDMLANVRESEDLAEASSDDINREYDALKKHDIKTLRGLIKQQHRIIDTSEFRTKDHAISHYLRTKYGNKRVAAAFGLSESEVNEVEVQGADRYEYTHGKKPKGYGNWYFSKHKSIDFSKLAPHHEEDDDDEEAERRRKFQAAMRAVGDSAKGMPGLGFKGGTYNPQKHRKESESVEGEIVESELHRAVSSGMKDLLHSGDHATFKKVAAHLGHPEWQTNPSESDLKSCSTPKLQKAHDHMYKGHPLGESVDMISEVEVQGADRYEYTHGKKPKGFGNWYFSKHKNIDFGAHKEGEDHVSIRGTYGEAKKQATAWAKSKGHAVIHVQT